MVNFCVISIKSYFNITFFKNEFWGKPSLIWHFMRMFSKYMIDCFSFINIDVKIFTNKIQFLKFSSVWSLGFMDVICMKRFMKFDVTCDLSIMLIYKVRNFCEFCRINLKINEFCQREKWFEISFVHQMTWIWYFLKDIVVNFVY